MKDLRSRRKEAGYASDMLPGACKMCSSLIFIITDMYTKYTHLMGIDHYSKVHIETENYQSGISTSSSYDISQSLFPLSVIPTLGPMYSCIQRDQHNNGTFESTQNIRIHFSDPKLHTTTDKAKGSTIPVWDL